MKILLAVAILVLGVFLYYGISFYQKFSIAQKLISKAMPYESGADGSNKTMLVLGDSTAVGVGADAATDTVPALLSKQLRISQVENQAVSGARTVDLFKQIGKTRAEEYDFILIMIGANDIIRFVAADSSAKHLEEALKILPKHRRLVVVLSAGNLGGAKLFPWFIRPFHARLNQNYHQTFAKIVKNAGGQYVNLYENPKTDPFVQNPEGYLAGDGLHPSSKGYAVWFSKILEQTDL